MSDNRPEIVLDGDITPFRAKLREATSELNRFGNEGAASLQRLGGPLATLQTKFVAISGLISGLAFGSGIKSAIDQADALNEMSERTGVAIDSLARLKFAGEQTGVSLDSISNATKKLSKLMIEAGSGDNAIAQKLAAFGVSGEQIKQMDIEGALQSIADRIRELPEAARQGALENLAKGFGDLVPLLKDGAQGLQDMASQADRLGVTSGYLSAAAGADELNDSIDRLKSTATGVVQRFVGDMLPALTGATEGMSRLLLSAEENKETILSLGTVAIGGTLTLALRSLTTQLYEASAGWITNQQTARQAAIAKTAAAQSTANSTAALQAHAAMLVVEAEAAVASASGMARLTVVQNQLIPARKELSAITKIAEQAEQALTAAKAEGAAKTSLTSMALNAMGGPLGAIISLIGLGATAWVAFGSNGVNAVRSVNDEIAKGREVLARYQREQKYGSGDEGQLRSSLEAIEKRISVLVQSSGASAAAAAELSRLRSEAEALQSALDGIETKNKPAAAVHSSALDDFLKGLGKASGGKENKQATDPSLMSYYEAALAEEKRLASEKDALREYTKGEELTFWKTLSTYADLSAKDRISIEKKVADLTVATRRQEAKEKLDVDNELARHKEAMSLGEIEAARAAAELAVSNGTMTKEQLLSLESDFEQRKFEIQRAALEDRLMLATLDPSTSEAEKQRINDALMQLDQQYGIKKIQLQKKLADQTDKVWDDLKSRMSSLWDKGIQSLMNGTFRWKNAFKAIGTELTSWFANSVVGPIVKKWIEGLATQLAAKLGFLSAEQTAQTASSATVTATKATEATAVSAANAVEAGTGSAAAMSSIPWVGPVLALAAMAAVFAAVSGMGSKVKSASRGYDIPKGLNPMTQLHEEEMVLPSHLANPLRSLLGGGGESSGGQGGDSIFAPQYNIHTMDGRSLERYVKKNARAFMPGVRELARIRVKK